MGNNVDQATVALNIGEAEHIFAWVRHRVNVSILSRSNRGIWTLLGVLIRSNVELCLRCGVLSECIVCRGCSLLLAVEHKIQITHFISLGQLALASTGPNGEGVGSRSKRSNCPAPPTETIIKEAISRRQAVGVGCLGPTEGCNCGAWSSYFATLGASAGRWRRSWKGCWLVCGSWGWLARRPWRRQRCHRCTSGLGSGLGSGLVGGICGWLCSGFVGGTGSWFGSWPRSWKGSGQGCWHRSRRRVGQ